ncbi:insulinase family protein [bacterium]|nr:insulinase family protein [bacterium]
MLDVRKTVTDQGVRVVTERMDSVRSVATGFWFETGSRDESPAESGISHFLEHMMFKGTKRRSALRIAREIEQVGGFLNAFTSKEVTAYYAHLLDDYHRMAVDTLADMMSESTFAEKMVQREQGVILEEISSYEDQPDDVCHEDFTKLMYGDHSLGRPVLGTRETVSSFTQEDLIKYWSTHYIPERAVVAAAGAVDHDKLVKMVERKLKLQSHNNGLPSRELPDPVRERDFLRRKEIVQAHMCLGTRGLSYHDKRRYAFFVLNTVLGSGMSSRLFQRIRERNGLCYSIYSFHEAYSDNGMFGIYTGLEEKQVKRAEAMIRAELRKLVETPLGKTELKRSKAQLKGALTLGLENVSARMNRLARMEIYLKKYTPLDELLDGIDSVTADEIQELAADLFRDENLSVSYVLPANGK